MYPLLLSNIRVTNIFPRPLPDYDALLRDFDGFCTLVQAMVRECEKVLRKEGILDPISTTTGDVENRNVFTVVDNNHAATSLMNGHGVAMNGIQAATNESIRDLTSNTLNVRKRKPNIVAHSKPSVSLLLNDEPLNEENDNKIEMASPAFVRKRKNSIIETFKRDTRSNSVWNIHSDVTIEVDLHCDDSDITLNSSLDSVKMNSVDLNLLSALSTTNQRGHRLSMSGSMSSLSVIDEAKDSERFSESPRISRENLLHLPNEGTPSRQRRLSLPVILYKPGK